MSIEKRTGRNYVYTQGKLEIVEVEEKRMPISMYAKYVEKNRR